MKRFSLKLKLTAMYSFYGTGDLSLPWQSFSLSGNEILTSAPDALKRTCAGKCR